MTEQELARHVVSWLDAQHYDVYQEVQPETAGPIADIVVDVAGYGWVIECKMSFGLPVIAQAERWQRLGVTRVSVATPSSGPSLGSHLGNRICRQFGIGRLRVSAGFEVNEEFEPRFVRARRRRAVNEILTCCHAGHKTCAAAGSANGGHWTPYRETITGVREFLATRGDWVCLQEIVSGISHHYGSTSAARACLSRWLRTVEADKGWIEHRKVGRRLEFRLKEKTDEAR